MSGKILIGLVFCFFFACTNTYAAYVSSIFDPVKEGEWKIAVFKDKTNAKKFKVRTGTPLPGFVLLTDAKITEISSNGIQINYGCSNALSMFFKFGQADRVLEEKWTDGVISELGYNGENMYGLGLKYVEEVDDGLIIGGDLQVNVYAGENVDHVSEGGVPATLILSPGEGELREFQGSLLFGQKINIVPEYLSRV
ncbi:MAG: hypothetical protein KJ893_07635, partial [Candidatus Omnitrophica bacterium]|nr:hypothetical protein [Candidatus Omnitrophota bacterium]